MMPDQPLGRRSTLALELMKARAAVALSRPKALAALAIGAAASLLSVQLNADRTALASIVLSFGLAWLSAIDIDRFKLPDILTLPLLLAGLADAASAGGDAFIERGIGAVFGFVCLIAVAALYRRARDREGIGRGDVKLLAAGGAWIGWSGLPAAVLIASACALPVAFMRAKSATGDKRLAFGPFLAMGVWTAWMWSPR